MPEDCIRLKDILSRRTINQSCQMIQSLAKKNGIEIYHALNGGEQNINDHYVNGYHPESQTTFDFHGCYWHSYPTHFPDRNIRNRHNCMTMDRSIDRQLRRHRLWNAMDIE